MTTTESHLIIFPHGLGDQIALVPVLRAWCEATNLPFTSPDGVVHALPSIAVQRRFNSSPLDHCPYIDQVHYTLSNPWQDYGNHNLKVGLEAAKFEGLGTSFKYGHSHILFVANTQDYLKLFGVDIKDYKPEVFISNEDRMIASKVIYDLVGNNSYGFVQTRSGDPARDLPIGYGRAWIETRKELTHILEVGQELKNEDLSINAMFEIMNRADAVVLPNSTFWHAAGALNKKIDLAYFPRGSKGSRRYEV